MNGGEEEACEERCDEQGKAPEADGKGYKKVNWEPRRLGMMMLRQGSLILLPVRHHSH